MGRRPKDPNFEYHYAGKPLPENEMRNHRCAYKPCGEWIVSVHVFCNRDYLRLPERLRPKRGMRYNISKIRAATAYLRKLDKEDQNDLQAGVDIIPDL
jgi:hypothetical protein